MRPQDARVRRGQRVVANQQLFVELFAGAQTGEGDGDIAAGMLCITHRQARQGHHALGQFADADGFAHVEHKHIPALCHGACLQHQLSGFGNGHEVAGDLRVRHGDGAAVRDLLAKQRDHAAAGAQHVAKAHHGKTGGAAPGGRSLGRAVRCAGKRGLGSVGHGLQYQLGHAFAGPHHIGGAHGLVGRDQHKVPHVLLQRYPHHVQRAEHVVLYAFCCVGLDHGHMLVGSCVVDAGGAVQSAQLGHALRVSHAGQQGRELALDDALLGERLQFLVDAVERELAVIDQQQLCGTQLRQLAA